MKHTIELKVNGEAHDIVVESHRTLLEVLRESLGFTGTKEACDLGSCGACTVLIDGQPILSCLTLALEVEGKEITTIEGLADKGQLHPIQKAFVEKGAVQCGFCTPGLVLSSKALLESNPKPTEQEVRQAIAGHLCRCTGFVKVVEAVLTVGDSRIEVN